MVWPRRTTSRWRGASMGSCLDIAGEPLGGGSYRWPWMERCIASWALQSLMQGGAGMVGAELVSVEVVGLRVVRHSWMKRRCHGHSWVTEVS